MKIQSVLFVGIALLAAAHAQDKTYVAAIYSVVNTTFITTPAPTTTTTTPTTTTPTTTTPTTTSPTTTTTPTTTTPTTTTPTTTEVTTTTPTTTTPTTTPTTTTTTDTPPSSARNFFHVRQPRSVRAEEETIMHECSGTLIGNNDVITTASCIQRIQALAGLKRIMIGTTQNTDATPGSATVYYDVSKAHLHGNYNSTTNANNIAVLKLAKDVDMGGDKARDIFWHTAKPAVATPCQYTYWKYNGAQASQVTNTVLCISAVDERVCATGFTDTTCVAGSEGGALVCDNKIAGVYSAASTADCTSNLRSFHDVAMHEKWVWDIVSGAPTVGVSVLSLAAVLIAVVNAL